MGSSSSTIFCHFIHHRGYGLEGRPWLASCHLTGKKRQGAMIYLVIEACKSRLLGQRLLSCEPLLIQADGMNRTCTLHMIITQIMPCCRTSTLGYPCLLSGVHCHNTDPWESGLRWAYLKKTKRLTLCVFKSSLLYTVHGCVHVRKSNRI